MNKFKRLLGGNINIKQYFMVIALVAIVTFFGILSSGKLFAPMNVSNIIFQNAYVIILAIGMLICILTGGNIDLSVGSVVALVGACVGNLIIRQKMDVYLAAGIGLALGLLIGCWHGFWIAYVRIPAFIVTLSGMLVYRGLTITLLAGQTLSPFPAEFKQYSTGFLPDLLGEFNLFGAKLNGFCMAVGVTIVAVTVVVQLINYNNRRRKGYAVGRAGALIAKLVVIGAVVLALFFVLARYKGVPTVLVLAGILLLVYTFFTSSTVMGRHIYALGGNEKAARLSGVKTNGLLFFAYANMGLLAAVAGLVFAARLDSSSPQAGQNFELDAIAACYIGGASAYGGIGTIGGALIGALIMGVLNNGMSINGIATDTQMVVKGLVLLGAVAFDVISKKQTALPAIRLGRKKKAQAGNLAL
ncbi:MAG: sugar ABC transporter permease [Oscillospiraceae bacterium]|jgi:putative multiple sugar transport system permease protein|nr:sugar ABC transporter permease [Oscillospiraceae bacterium]